MIQQHTPSFLEIIKMDLLRISSVSGFRMWIKILHPRFFPVLFLRISFLFYRYRLLRPLSFIFSLANVILFGLEATPRCKIGPGLLIPHTSGTVIGAEELGCNVTIFQGVTLGAKFADLNFSSGSRPVLEDDVVIGAGAKILGAIRVGKNSIIASNTLLLESVPENSFAIGVPAIVKER